MIEFFKTYNGKISLLYLGMLLTAILVFFVSVRPTLKLRQQHNRNQQALAKARTAPQEIARLQSVLSNWEGHSQEAATQERVFQLTSQFCLDTGLKILSMPEPTVTAEGQYETSTYKISVQGDYKSILQLMYELEAKERVGKIASTEFYTKRNRRKKRDFLHADIYLQNLRTK